MNVRITSRSGSQLNVQAATLYAGGMTSTAGLLNIASGTTITVAGVLIFDGCQVINAGTISVTLTYYFYMMKNAVLTNSGTIDLQGDDGIYLNSVVGTTAVINSGTIKKSGGTNYAQMNVPLTAQSGSQFLLQSGSFYVGGVASTGATFNVASGTNLIFNTSDTHTFDASSILSRP